MKKVAYSAIVLALSLSGHHVYAESKISKLEELKYQKSTELQATHGVMAGDITRNSAVIWSRTNQEATMRVIVKSRYGKSKFETDVSAENDYTGKIKVKRLKADTHYQYKVSFASHNGVYGKPTIGSFKTAPKKNDAQALKISWSGDFAGQNVCRDAEEGFPIFNAIVKEYSDLFIGLGDMIYADNTCDPVGRYGNDQVPGDFIVSADLPNFWAHWRYSREDETFQQLLASTPYYAIWDDHEVVNDFGPLHDTRDTPPYIPGESLLPIGLKSFLDYNPISPKHVTPNRLYRNIRWGKNAELFFLDNRQYRDANLAADAEGREKTMLGREQTEWLKQKIKKSNATWKIIVSSVPISINTGFPADLGRDGWANDDANAAPTVEGIPQSDTGFERELIDILELLRDEDANVLFITTDVHFAEVFRYTPFTDTPEFQFYEVVIGPGNAGIFPNFNFDTTLGTESLFFHGPESFLDVETWEQAKTWFNYGTIEIDKYGNLNTQVKGVNGETLYSLDINP